MNPVAFVTNQRKFLCCPVAVTKLVDESVLHHRLAANVSAMSIGPRIEFSAISSISCAWREPLSGAWEATPLGDEPQWRLRTLYI
jgi:hypothetical protein